MAASALDIVTVAQLKTAVRLVGDDAAHDELLTGLIQGAAVWIEEQCRIGVIDTPQFATAVAPGRNEPIEVAHRSLTIDNFHYRKTGRGTYTAATQAAVLTPGAGLTVVEPPAEGWPAAHLDVWYVRRTAASSVPGAVRAAIMMLARDMYDLRGEIRPASWAVTQIIMPYRDMSVGDANAASSTWPTPQTTVPETPIAPPTHTVTLRAAWGATPDAARAALAQGQTASGNTVRTPPNPGDDHDYLALWRSASAGGDPTSVMIPGQSFALQRTSFGDAAALTIADTPGFAIVSVVPLDAELYADTTLEVS